MMFGHFQLVYHTIQKKALPFVDLLTKTFHQSFFTHQMQQDSKKRIHENTQTQEPPQKKRKLPKRKIAIICGYIGTNFHGLQL